MSVDARWRLFCAIELSDEVRARAAEHIARLRHSLPDVRAAWDRAEKMHITLKFFGDVEQRRVPELSLATERAAQCASPFTLDIAGAGTFPPRGPALVLWLGVRDASGELAQLRAALEDECAAQGFKREERPFHPHLTIARLRQPAGAGVLAARHRELACQGIEMPVNEIVLLRSELRPNGSLYTPLARHGLRANSSS